MPVAATQPISSQAASVMRRAVAHPGVVGGAQQAGIGLQTMAQSALASGLVPHSLEARRREKAKAHAEVLDEKPGFLTRVMDRISSLGSMFFAYDFVALMGLGAVTGGIAAGFSKIAGWTNSETVGKVGGWFGRRSEGLKGQRKALKRITISEGVAKTGEALHNTTGRVFGEESAITRGMGSVAEGAEKAQSGLNRGFGFVGKKISNALGGVVSSFDPEIQAMAERNELRAQRHFSRLSEHLQKAETLLGTHGDQLAADVLNGEGQVLRANSSFVPSTPNVKEGMRRTAAEHMGNIRSNFAEVQQLLSSGTPSAEQAQRAQTLMAEMRGDLGAVRALKAEVGETALKEAAGELSSALGKMHRPLSGVVGRLEKAENWRSLPESIANLPRSFGNTDMHHAMFSGAILAGMGAEAAHTAFGVKHDFHMLKTMVEAVEGKKVSTMHVLMGDIPQCLHEARSHFFGTHRPEVIAEAVAGVANLAFLKKGAGMAAMFPVIAAPMVGKALADTNPTIRMYEAITRLQNESKPVTPAMYAEFVHALVEKPEVLDMNAHRPESRERLFTEYAEKNTPIDQVLKDIHTGAFEQRAKDMDKEQAVQEANAAVQQSKPVVGKHTENLANQRVGTSRNHTQPVANENAELPGSHLHNAEIGPRSQISQVASAERLSASPHAAVGGAA